MEYPLNLSREAIKKILAKSLELSKVTDRGEIWSNIANSLGWADYKGEEFEEEPIELESVDEESFREDSVVFCRRKDGIVYPVSLEEYASKILEEERGEAEEWEVSERASSMRRIGEVFVPEDACGGDEFLGSVHTHPHYPISPSGPDVDGAVQKGGKVMCIASKNTFACVFGKPEQIAKVPSRAGERYGSERLCFIGKTVQEDLFGNIREEEYEICPREYIEGHDEAWVNDIRKMVRKGDLEGVCYKSPSTLFGEKVICEFRVGDETRMEEFHVKELEKI